MINRINFDYLASQRMRLYSSTRRYFSITILSCAIILLAMTVATCFRFSGVISNYPFSIVILGVTGCAIAWLIIFGFAQWESSTRITGDHLEADTPLRIAQARLARQSYALGGLHIDERNLDVVLSRDLSSDLIDLDVYLAGTLTSKTHRGGKLRRRQVREEARGADE